MMLPTLALGTFASAAQLATFDGLTFADTGPTLYFPLREVSQKLDWRLARDAKGFTLRGVPVPASTLRSMQDGRRLVEVRWLTKAGAIVNYSGKTGLTTVKNAKSPGKAFYVRKGVKRVFINKKTQMIVAYQGRRTVFRSNVSTGRRGQETPTGIFRAKGKEKMHLSSLYNNAPMPWSVHVVGNIFVHGFTSTPRNGSSGCIRLPLTGANPARWFYYWVDIGTPITILGKWPKGAA